MVKADPKRNYYADLELEPTASIDDVKKQFRKLARIYHPDRNPGKEVEFVPKFQAIQAAHEILGDPEQRAKYDADRRRLGYGPRTSPQQTRPAYNQWQTYNSVPRATGGVPPYAPGASAYNAYKSAYNTGMPQTPPRPHPTSNARERVRTSSGFFRGTGQGTGANAWTETRPPPSGFRHRPPPTTKDDADMYYSAFQTFGPRRASQANPRRGSGIDGAESPRGRRKGGFDPNTPGADEPSVKMAGYNTRPRPEASGPPSEEEVSGGSAPELHRPTQHRTESSDDLEEANRRARTKKAAAKKKAAEQAAEKRAAEAKNRAGATRIPNTRSGSDADSSGSAQIPTTPGERVKAMPSRKWKNFNRSEEASIDLDGVGAEPMYDTFTFPFSIFQPKPVQDIVENSFCIPSAKAGYFPFTKPSQQTFHPQNPQEARLFDKIQECAESWTKTSPQEQPQSQTSDCFVNLSKTNPSRRHSFVKMSTNPSDGAVPSTVPEVQSFRSGRRDGTIGKKPTVFTSTQHFNIFESDSRVLFEEVSPRKNDSTGVDSIQRKTFVPISDEIPSKRPEFPSKTTSSAIEADLTAQMRTLPKNAFKTFITSKDYFTNISHFQRNEVPNADTPKGPSINTNFSAEDLGAKPFTFNSPNMSTTSSQASNNAEASKPFPGPNLFASANANYPPKTATHESSIPPPVPTVEEVADSPEKFAQEGPVEPAPTSQQRVDPTTGEKPLPVKFSADHWKETFKEPVFAMPKVPVTVPAQSAPGVKSGSSSRKQSMQKNRSPSKAGDKTGESVPTGSVSRPIVVEEYKPDAEGDVDAMDIDTPPSSTEPLRGPRLVRVQATRSDWTDAKTSSGNVKGEPKPTTPTASRQTTPSNDRRRKSGARDAKTTTPAVPTTLNMSSLKSHLSSQESGVGDLGELHVNLPFESRASTQHPSSAKYEDISTIISHPKPPHAPILPSSATISELHYRNLLAQVSAYMGAFHKYETEVLAQFSLRCNEGSRFGTGVPSTDATALLNAKGEPRGKGVLAYAEALREETTAREEWVKATDEYMHVVTGWAMLKGMVLKRGFSKPT